MAVSNVESAVIRLGDGIAVDFDFDIEAVNAASIKVGYIVGTTVVVVDPAGYSVSMNGALTGGVVTFNVAPVAATKIYIYRETDQTQVVSVSRQQGYNPAVVERVWDKLTLLIQELSTAVKRSVKTGPDADPDQLVNDLETARQEALAAAVAADADATQTALDRIATGLDAAAADADRVQTGLDRIQTGLDAASADADATATAADRVVTTADRVQTQADRVQTGLDRIATAADRVQTGLDRVAAAADAADAELYAGQVQGNIIPVGAIAFFADDTPPSGWLVCDGSSVTAVYPELRSYLLVAGSPFGTVGADPKLPDLRGEFIRGWDGGRGIDAGRVFGSSQLDAFQGHAHDLFGRGHSSASGLHNELGDAGLPQTDKAVVGAIGAATEFGGSGPVRTGTETRPRNVALLPCIKAFGQVDMTGMADLSALLTAIASTAEAQAGANNTKLMTPQRVEDHMLANALGWGQTWQAVTRVSLTVYQNTTGRPIGVSLRTGTGALAALEVSVDNVTWVSVASQGGAEAMNIFGIIPNGHYYRARATNWWELR